MRTLTIISHTEHYKNASGDIVGWGSTVTEINHLLHIFDRITHIAMLHKGQAPPNALPYCSDRITFVSIPVVGGAGFRNKMSIVTSMPTILTTIRRHLKHSDYFQFRAPTGIGVFVISYLIVFSSRKGWFKYAGNWNQQNAPWAYQFQRWLLKKQSRKVTINGRWPNQPAHCLSFENPCLTNEELMEGRLLPTKNTFEFPLNFCFVGRMESAKGIDLIIDAFCSMNEIYKSKIGDIHLVGGGEKLEFYKDIVKNSDFRFRFHGFLSRENVKNVFKQSHVIVLPSASEGFPKVITEAMNFGCIPIVSNVSSISHYIHHGINGFLLEEVTSTELKSCLEHILNLSKESYAELQTKNSEFIKLFTYDYYNHHLLEDILQ